MSKKAFEHCNDQTRKIPSGPHCDGLRCIGKMQPKLQPIAIFFAQLCAAEIREMPRNGKFPVSICPPSLRRLAMGPFHLVMAGSQIKMIVLATDVALKSRLPALLPLQGLGGVHSRCNACPLIQPRIDTKKTGCWRDGITIIRRLNLRYLEMERTSQV